MHNPRSTTSLSIFAMPFLSLPFMVIRAFSGRITGTTSLVNTISHYLLFFLFPCIQQAHLCCDVVKVEEFFAMLAPLPSSVFSISLSVIYNRQLYSSIHPKNHCPIPS